MGWLAGAQSNCFNINVLNTAVGGAEGDRTPDLVIANDALSQLSYSPVQRMAHLSTGLPACQAAPPPRDSRGKPG